LNQTAAPNAHLEDLDALSNVIDTLSNGVDAFLNMCNTFLNVLNLALRTDGCLQLVGELAVFRAFLDE
jgi:hypothetical protein